MNRKLAHNLILVFLVFLSVVCCSYSVFAAKYTLTEIPYSFDNAFPLNNGLIKIEKNSTLYGLMDKDGKMLLEPEFTSISDFKQGFAAISKNSNYGFVDENGTIIAKPQFKKVLDFSKEGLARISNGTKWGLINTKGTIVLPIEFDNIYDFQNGYAKILKNGKYSFVNKTGSLITTAQFDDERDFQEGLAPVKKNNSWSIIDINGNTTGFNFQIQDMKSFQDDMVPIKKDNKWGLANKKGEIILKPEFDDLTFVSKNLIKANKGDLYGIINEKGESIINIEYESINLFQNDYLVLIKNKLYGLADIKGNIIYPPTLNYIYNVQENKAIVNDHDIYGILDISGQLKSKLNLKSEFDMIYPFHEGVARVKKGNKYGFIDELGKVIVDPVYDSASDFNDGLAYVMKNDASNDISNNTLNDPEYKKYHRWGFINRLGSTDIDRDFDSVTTFKNNEAVVKKDDKWFIIKNSDTKSISNKITSDTFKTWKIKFSTQIDDSFKKNDDDNTIITSIDKTMLNNIKVTDSNNKSINVSFKFQSPDTIIINPPLSGYKIGENYKITIMNNFKSKNGDFLEPSITTMNFSVTN